jgi:hypothetical protein
MWNPAGQDQFLPVGEPLDGHRVGTGSRIPPKISQMLSHFKHQAFRRGWRGGISGRSSPQEENMSVLSPTQRRGFAM